MDREWILSPQWFLLQKSILRCRRAVGKHFPVTHQRLEFCNIRKLLKSSCEEQETGYIQQENLTNSHGPCSINPNSRERVVFTACRDKFLGKVQQYLQQAWEQQHCWGAPGPSQLQWKVEIWEARQWKVFLTLEKSLLFHPQPLECFCSLLTSVFIRKCSCDTTTAGSERPEYLAVYRATRC